MTKTEYDESDCEDFEGHFLSGGATLFYDDRGSGVMWGFEVPELGLRGFVRFTLEELAVKSADALVALWQRKIEEMKAQFRETLKMEKEVNEAVEDEDGQ